MKYLNTKNVPKEPKHLRPVGQTSPILKLLEYQILKECENIYDDEDGFQFAYKEGVSTADAILTVLGTVLEGLESSQCVVRILFLYYTSAFQTINRQDILDDLKEQGAKGWLLQLIKDLFEDRTHYVQSNGETWTRKPCNVGIIQGSVTSPRYYKKCEIKSWHCENNKIFRWQ